MNHEIHAGSSLPAGWDAFSLGSKASFVTSGSRGWARFYSESGDLFLRSQNIQSGHLDLEDRQHVLPPAGAEGERTRVQPNDLLVTITGNSVGNVAISSNDLGIAYISQHVGMIRLVDPSLAPYACWYLSPGAPGNRQILDAQTGQSKPGLNLQNLKELVVAAPKDKHERNLIVAALDDVQGQADEMQMLLSKKRLLKQAAMQELLTGKRRLPGFEGEWEVKRLDEIADVIDPHPSHRAPDETSSGIPFLGIGDLDERGNVIGRKLRLVDREVLREHAARYSFDEELIGLGRVASIGKVVCLKKFPGGCAISPTLGIIRGRFAKRNYIMLALRTSFVTDQFAQIMSGSTRSSIGMEVLRKLNIKLPPTAPEQDAIAEILNQMDTELATLEAHLDKTHALKQGMMQQLLTGKIRLK